MGWLLLLVAYFRFILSLQQHHHHHPHSHLFPFAHDIICSLSIEVAPYFPQIKIEFMLSLLFIIFLADFSDIFLRLLCFPLRFALCFWPGYGHLLFWGLPLQHTYIAYIYSRHYSIERWFNKMYPAECNRGCYATYILNYNDSPISFDIACFVGSVARPAGIFNSNAMRCDGDRDTKHLWTDSGLFRFY